MARIGRNRALNKKNWRCKHLKNLNSWGWVNFHIIQAFKNNNNSNNINNVYASKNKYRI